MEIKLKTTPADADSEAIVDENGALWNFSGSIPAFGIFSAVTEGPDGEIIRGFYQNGRVFIVNLSEAKKYFNLRELEDCREMHHA